MHRRERACTRLALATSAFVALAASSVLVGWIIDNETLKHLAVGSVVMIPVTAITLLLAAVALAIRTIDSTSRVWRWSGHLVSGLVLVLGSTMLAQRIGGFELRMNLLLFADALRRYPYRPLGLMAGNSAIAFTLLGIGLALPDARLSDRRLANGVALGDVAVSAIALVGYAFGARALYSFDQYAAMAVSTAMCLLAIGIGVIASRPQTGLAALLIADDAGGVFTRRMLPIALTVPFLLGLAWLAGRSMELVSRESGVANFVVAIAAIYSAFLFHSARSVCRQDARTVGGLKMGYGIDHPTSLDFISFDARADQVVLTISEERKWTGSDAEMRKLQDKLSNYLSYAVDGGLVRKFPEYAAKSVRIRLDCVHAPPPNTLEFLDEARRRLSDHKVDLVVSVFGKLDSP